MFVLPFPTTFHFLSYPSDVGTWGGGCTGLCQVDKAQHTKVDSLPGNCRVQQRPEANV